MTRRYADAPGAYPRVPRLRGDDPMASVVAAEGLVRSPPTRG